MGQKRKELKERRKGGSVDRHILLKTHNRSTDQQSFQNVLQITCKIETKREEEDRMRGTGKDRCDAIMRKEEQRWVRQERDIVVRNDKHLRGGLTVTNKWLIRTK